MKKTLTALAAIVPLSYSAFASTGTATSVASIVPTLTITETQEADFGSIVVSGTGHVIVGLTSGGTRYLHEGTAYFLGSYSNPEFKVTGSLNAPVRIVQSGGFVARTVLYGPESETIPVDISSDYGDTFF